MIQRSDHPEAPANPYPDAASTITGFRYDSALVLLRLKDAPKMRDGEDADYLTGQDYFVSWRDGAGEWTQIRVPEGLLTDLTSVPRPLRWVVGRVGPWLEAAIVHDYLYVAWSDVPGRGAREADRAFADDLMRAAMREARVNGLLVWAIHASLRLFGAQGFRRSSERRYVDLSDPAVQAQLPFRMPR